MNYFETIEQLSYFFADCAKFWNGDAYKALDDVRNIDHDPFSPNGKRLDEEAKSDFIACILEMLG